jgi:hypothetical protein
MMGRGERIVGCLRRKAPGRRPGFVTGGGNQVATDWHSCECRGPEGGSGRLVMVGSHRCGGRVSGWRSGRMQPADDVLRMLLDGRRVVDVRYSGPRRRRHRWPETRRWARCHGRRQRRSRGRRRRERRSERVGGDLGSSTSRCSRSRSSEVGRGGVDVLRYSVALQTTVMI